MTLLEVRWPGIVGLLGLILVLSAVVLTLRLLKMRIARDQIINYLKANEFTMISLERIRENINPRYTDEFLERLPQYFPNDLRRARLREKDGTLTKKGLARILKERQAVEEGAPGERAAG